MSDSKSTFDKILRAVNAELRNVDTRGCDKHYLLKKPIDRIPEKITVPCTMIAPGRSESTEPATNRSNNIGYPVTVLLIQEAKQGESDEVQLDGRFLEWRKEVRQKFVNENLTNVPEVYEVNWEPGPIIHPGGDAMNLDVSVLTLRFYVRETRT